MKVAPHAFRRLSLLAAALAVTMLWSGAPAPAAVEISTGIRYVYDGGSLGECSAKAKTALNAYLTGATESTPGSGEWVAFGQNGNTGSATSAATVRCYALGKGFVVTFTCAVQTPDNPYNADALCLDVAHNFSGKPVTPLAPMPPPTPVPTGCSPTNLFGTWASDDKPGLTLTMTMTGEVTDSDGVSGNWALKGNTATLTYYGNHTMTLSADGKHLSGDGYHLTRKC